MASPLRRFAFVLTSLVGLSCCAGSYAGEYPGNFTPASPYAIGRGYTQGYAPFFFVGRISVAFGSDDYIGSGTVVKPKGVLTAGHMLWDRMTGWGTNLKFERGYYDGTRLTLLRPVHKYILAGYSQNVYAGGSETDLAFDRDTGVMNFSGLAAKGACAAYWSNRTLLNGYYTTMSLGYGAEMHTGEQLLKVGSIYGVHSYTPVFTGAAYCFNDGYIIEGGMSGGPVMALYNGKWYVVGVNVSGNDSGMGMRAIDSAANSFIATYLK